MSLSLSFLLQGLLACRSGKLFYHARGRYCRFTNVGSVVCVFSVRPKKKENVFHQHFVGADNSDKVKAIPCHEAWLPSSLSSHMANECSRRERADDEIFSHNFFCSYSSSSLYWHVTSFVAATIASAIIRFLSTTLNVKPSKVWWCLYDVGDGSGGAFTDLQSLCAIRNIYNWSCAPLRTHRTLTCGCGLWVCESPVELEHFFCSHSVFDLRVGASQVIWRTQKNLTLEMCKWPEKECFNQLWCCCCCWRGRDCRPSYAHAPCAHAWYDTTQHTTHTHTSIDDNFPARTLGQISFFRSRPPSAVIYREKILLFRRHIYRIPLMCAYVHARARKSIHSARTCPLTQKSLQF